MEDEELRGRIVAAAAGLLREGGLEAVNTRAVVAAADTHAPAIYRLFGGKAGLLDAVAEHAFMAYSDTKALAVESNDPVQRFCRAWELHIEFGLAHPDIYVSIYGTRRQELSDVQIRIEGQLEALVQGVAAAGRLSVSVEAAIGLVHSVGRGTVLTLIGNGPAPKPDTFVDANLRMLLNAILTPVDEEVSSTASSAAGHAATTLLANLRHLDGFSAGERTLLNEWLRRVVDP